ncbi:MAG: ferritin family protein [Candidatus Coatesbacteria bacterium]|nr:ferritin family protein [Candidatus Coatesbacteria bacterium]
MSDEAIDKVAKGIAEAIRTENEGRYFFLMAANSTTDPKGKEVFETLADEELVHLDFLKKQYLSLVERGEFDKKLKLGPKSDFSGANPIFSEQLLERLSDAHFEMSALSIGVRLELYSMSFYKKQSEESSDPFVKRFFSELAEWEAGHYHALLKQLDALKDFYWEAGGFSPF